MTASRLPSGSGPEGKAPHPSPDLDGDMSARVHRRRTIGAASLVIVASVVFTLSDVATQGVAGSIPTFEVVWFRYLAYAVMAVALLARRPSIAVLRPANMKLQIWRGIAAFGSAGFFVAGLYHLPVADATAINFVSPLLVTGLAATWLKEHVGLKQWIATFLGFCGVLLIMRPGGASFRWEAIFPLMAALCWAVVVVFTRRMSATDPARLTMVYTAVIGLIAASVFLPFEWVKPPAEDWLLLLIVAVSATAGHALIIIAYAYAPASLLAPLSYAQLVWASILGYIFFGYAPGLVAIVGMLMIVGSGLYVARLGSAPPPSSRPNSS